VYFEAKWREKYGEFYLLFSILMHSRWVALDGIDGRFIERMIYIEELLAFLMLGAVFLQQFFIIEKGRGLRNGIF
jgi:hypothetical protein